ncbi:30S ribosomal protein S18-like isoform X3 [Vespula pensylvanica]|uniref:30S ribosomal protein S18-like isoform X3 n=2 Tax=Vespula pensylvanica TaxID=30213 RepID=UPI001CBA4408|nr:30S ribosomal protein S18-like isoform X3 [Vespula pensylvanica]
MLSRGGSIGLKAGVAVAGGGGGGGGGATAAAADVGGGGGGGGGGSSADAGGSRAKRKITKRRRKRMLCPRDLDHVGQNAEKNLITRRGDPVSPLFRRLSKYGSESLG